MLSLYERIECMAKERGFKNITELCAASGASRGSLTDLKIGRKKNLSAETLNKLADSLNVTIDELTGRDIEKPTSDEPQITFNDFTYAMFNESKALTEEDKSLLLQMARQLSDKNKKSGQTD